MQRRRRYIINKRHQYRLIASFVGVALLAMITTTLSIMHDVEMQIELHLRNAPLEITNTGDIILPVALRASAGVVLAYLVVLAALTAYYVYETRRIIGGVDKGLKRFGEGDLCCGIELKDCPDFGSLVDEFNEMLSASKGRIEGLKVAAAGLEEELALSGGDTGGKGAEATSLDGARARLGEIESILSEFDEKREGGETRRKG